MLVSVMQPYFFPYIGYFQLMVACDLFIVLDDAQYIEGGWMNRNRILVDGRPQWITLPVAKADHRLPTNHRTYLLDHRLAQKVRRRISAAYQKAPYYDETMTLLDEVLGCRDANVAGFNTHLLHCVARRLDIGTPFRLASGLPKRGSLKAQELVLDTCARVGASGYVNPIGGLELYDPAEFSRRGLTLRFLQSRSPDYTQFGGGFLPSLSMIDVMMFNPVAVIKRMLREYRLFEGRGVEVPAS